MYDCCDCLGHVSCSFTSFPLSTRSPSTVPLLLEQSFSAGRCPSFPFRHQLSVVLSMPAAGAESRPVLSALSLCLPPYFQTERPHRVIRTNVLISHGKKVVSLFQGKTMYCVSVNMTWLERSLMVIIAYWICIYPSTNLCNPNNNLLMTTILNRM